MKNKQQVTEKIAKLQQVKKQLKKEFVGIDSQIDQILDSMRTWYVFPETLNRPSVINLWGITGTFKTSVVRRIIDLLELNNRFKEIDSRKFHSSSEIREIIGIHDNSSDKLKAAPDIYLIDEFQNIRTIDKFGEATQVAENLSDLFALLSDGKVKYSRNLYHYKALQDLLDLIHQDRQVVRDRVSKYYKDNNYRIEVAEEMSDYDPEMEAAADNEKTPTVSRARVFRSIYHYEINGFSEFSRSKIDSFGNDLEEIMDYVYEVGSQILPDMVLDLTKSLIFIAGNLDNIFGDLTQHLDTDSISPDEFYEATKGANFNDAKECLLGNFRPEQVSRLGTNHVIFPSFNSNMYLKLISNLNKRVLASFKSIGVKLEIDKSVDLFLLKHTAIPSQGARGILSSHEFVVAANMSELATICMLSGSKTGKLSVKNNNVVLEAGKTKVEKDISVIDAKTLLNYPEPLNTRICAHEAGHAIAYLALFGKYPDLIKVRSSNSGIGGYVRFSLPELPTREDYKNLIAVALAGLAAEHLRFGAEGTSAGSVSDILSATQTASLMVKVYGMGDKLAAQGFSMSKDSISTHDTEESEKEVDNLVNEGLTLAFTVLSFYDKQHKALTEALKKQVVMKPEEMKKVVKL